MEFQVKGPVSAIDQSYRLETQLGSEFKEFSRTCYVSINQKTWQQLCDMQLKGCDCEEQLRFSLDWKVFEVSSVWCSKMKASQLQAGSLAPHKIYSSETPWLDHIPKNNAATTLTTKRLQHENVCGSLIWKDWQTKLQLICHPAAFCSLSVISIIWLLGFQAKRSNSCE